MRTVNPALDDFGLAMVTHAVLSSSTVNVHACHSFIAKSIDCELSQDEMMV